MEKESEVCCGRRVGLQDGGVREQRVTGKVRLRFAPGDALAVADDIDQCGHTGSVTSTAFSLDGELLATGSSDTTVILWNAHDGSMLRKLRGHSSVVYSLTFLRNSRHLVTGGSDKILVWDVDTGAAVHTLELHTGTVLVLACSPDGALLASGSADRTIRIWDTNTFKELSTIIMLAAVKLLAFSPDGQWLATGEMCAVHVWGNTASRGFATSLRGHCALVTALAFTPDSQRIITASRDGTCRVWDVRSGETLLEITASHPIHKMTLSPLGDRIALAVETERMVRIIDVSNGEQLFQLEGHRRQVTAIAFSPDGHFIATGSEDQQVRLWSNADGRDVLAFEDHVGGASTVTFAPVAPSLVSCGYDGSVAVYPYCWSKS